MTEEQRAKYGTAHYDRTLLEEHFTDKYFDTGKKEQGVTIKVKTLEEQKKEEEQAKQEAQAKLEAKAEIKKEIVKQDEVGEPQMEPIFEVNVLHKLYRRWMILLLSSNNIIGDVLRVVFIQGINN